MDLEGGRGQDLDLEGGRLLGEVEADFGGRGRLLHGLERWGRLENRHLLRWRLGRWHLLERRWLESGQLGGGRLEDGPGDDLSGGPGGGGDVKGIGCPW